jgi:hypothetical protein
MTDVCAQTRSLTLLGTDWRADARVEGSAV